MQYFAALQKGKKRVEIAREYLNKIADNNPLNGVEILESNPMVIHFV